MYGTDGGSNTQPEILNYLFVRMLTHSFRHLFLH